MDKAPAKHGRRGSRRDQDAEPHWGLGAAMGLTAMSLHVGSVELLALGSTELPAIVYESLSILGLALVGLLAGALATTSAWLAYGANTGGLNRRGRASLTLVALGAWAAATAATSAAAGLLTGTATLVALASIALGGACAGLGVLNLRRDAGPNRALLTTGAIAGGVAGMLLTGGPIFGALAASLAIVALAQTWGVGVPRNTPEPARSRSRG